MVRIFHSVWSLNGPKGRDILAQGKALGFKSEDKCGLKGRDKNL
jgi:hypothetical protein